MSREKVIELARADLGYTEDPAGSNRTKYGEAYGTNGAAWCVQALWFWFREAGERMAFFGGGKTASCSTLLRWYKEQGLTVPVSEVQAGDIVLLNFNGKGTPDHCGIVVDTMPPYDSIRTVEGNTTPGLEGSQDNGGCVALKTRYPRQIVAVCKPQYASLSAGMPGIVPEGQYPEDSSETSSSNRNETFRFEEEGTGGSASIAAARQCEESSGAPTMDDITGHWAEKEIRRCMEKGLMWGYPDGSFQPDKGVTRAELAAVLVRLEK